VGRLQGEDFQEKARCDNGSLIALSAFRLNSFNLSGTEDGKKR